MSQSLYLHADLFDREKKIKAAVITSGVAGALLLLAIFLKWSLPTLPQPVVDEGIEINLGSGDEGFGSDQPQLPGDPAPAQQVAYTPPQPVQAQEEDARDVETDDRVSDAPVIRKPVNPRPNATQIDNENKTVKATPAAQPVAATPAPPRPKAVLGRTVGGSGNGGNGAETYQRGGNEGVAGGTGDQGRPGGSPSGRAYTGGPRNFGVKVLNLPAQSFEDDFNENAKVAMDVVADASGRVSAATYQPRGSTTSSRQLIDIARRRAFELKLGASEGGQKGTVVFNFKVRG